MGLDPPIIIIAAVGTNGVIGSKKGLPWSIPEEYRHYLGLIKDQTVIMGRKSFEIFGKDLTSSTNIIVSTTMEQTSDILVCSSLKEALDYARNGPGRIFIAGGARIYREAIRHADAMYLSFMKGVYSGDTFFPEIDQQQWQVRSRTDHPKFEFVKFYRS